MVIELISGFISLEIAEIKLESMPPDNYTPKGTSETI